MSLCDGKYLVAEAAAPAQLSVAMLAAYSTVDQCVGTRCLPQRGGTQILRGVTVSALLLVAAAACDFTIVKYSVSPGHWQCSAVSAGWQLAEPELMLLLRTWVGHWCCAALHDMVTHHSMTRVAATV